MAAKKLFPPGQPRDRHYLLEGVGQVSNVPAWQEGLELEVLSNVDLDGPKFLSGKYEVSFVKNIEKKTRACVESLNYDDWESAVFLEHEKMLTHGYQIRLAVFKWLLMGLVGVSTAIVGAIAHMLIHTIVDFKFSLIKTYVDFCMVDQCMFWLPPLIWILFNCTFVFVASWFTTFVEPATSGSGIPPVKCYLNGIKMPGFVRIRTLFIKVLGIVCSVSGGLAVGKEGPMIHTGAIVASGIAQGLGMRRGSLKGYMDSLRDDKNRREFVAAGGAAGVASAFGTPLGGVLFSIEEGISWWNPTLVWQIFLCAMLAALFLHNLLSLYITKKWQKVMEAVGVAAVTALVGYGLSYSVNICYTSQQPADNFVPSVGKLNSENGSASVPENLVKLDDLTSGHASPYAQMFCPNGSYNAIAAMFFQSAEENVNHWQHGHMGSQFQVGSSFLPSSLVQSGGDLLELGHGKMFFPGKYSLIGAAAHLGGVVRMTLSLTLILVEATSNVKFGLPIMLTLMVAKIVGDHFNKGIYDLHIELEGVPVLNWSPPALLHCVKSRHVMSKPVVTLPPVVKLSNLVETLATCSHHGFPVVEPGTKGLFGKFLGLISWSQLLVLMQKKAFREVMEEGAHLPLSVFKDAYPCHGTVDVGYAFKDFWRHFSHVFISFQKRMFSSKELSYTLDLQPYLNPAPNTVSPEESFPRAYQLFRGLGLRHLVVIDSSQVVGMITRKDLARVTPRMDKGNAPVPKKQSVVSINHENSKESSETNPLANSAV
ncbi:unnamed protein product [Notodromas monacha]|uniref:Chloride channel protein n=1 Tax=Notodromas monacha TaxID=399045 RepID=A0A7R9GAC7_9CRUS|nr:unnamed protein product [Notodromas monacha]CAG0915205.1 unnamed protein product [Notodromas monacha]